MRVLTQLHGRTNPAGRNLAILGAYCLFLSAIEYMIPKPLPFFRIGLAHLPLILAVDIFPLRTFLVLVCIKVFGQALITGTLFSYIFLFSIAGTFFSAMFMYALRRIFGRERITFAGIGVAGAMVSSAAQLMIAQVFMFGESARYIAPPLLAAGLFTGIVLGIFCEAFTRYSKWYQKLITGNMEEGAENIFQGAESRERGIENSEQRILNRRGFYESFFSAKALFITGFLIIPALLFNPSTEYRCFQFLFFWFLVWLSGKKINVLLTLLIIFMIVAFNLIIPYGRVLFSIGPFRITSGALEAGIHRAVTFEALIMLSKICIRNDLKIPGSFGKLLCESLRIFSVLMNRKYKESSTKFSFRRIGKNIIPEIDKFMMELNREERLPSAVHKIKTKPAGFIILIILIVLSWLPWIFI